MRDIFPTEPCPNIMEPTQTGDRAIPQRTTQNTPRRPPDHNNLRADSRVKEGFHINIFYTPGPKVFRL